MPINPNIALQGQGLQLQDPLQSYGRVAQIQNYQQANQLNALKMQEAQRSLAARNALNQAYSSALDPKTGEVNLNQLRSSLATGGFGSQIPEVEKGILAMQKERAGLRKSQVELVKEKLEAVKPLYQQALSSQNPGAAMLEIHSAVHADPDLGPWLQSMGATAERGQQDLMAAISQGPQAIQQKILTSLASVDKLLPSLVSTDTGGGTQLGVRSQLTGAYTPTGVIGKTPLPADVMQQKLQQSIAGRPSITFSTEKTYGEKVAGGGAEEDLALFNLAENAPAQIAKIDDTLDVLQNQDINTGIGAEVFTILDQARAQFLADKAAGKRVTSTQYLDSLLGSSVFPQISELGIGARGLDTPAEREFLRKVMTGTISLNKDTLVEMAKLRRQGIVRSVDKFNRLVKEGSFDSFFKARRRPKRTVELPEPPVYTPQAQTPAPAVEFPAALRNRPDAAELEMLWQDMTPENRKLFME